MSSGTSSASSRLIVGATRPWSVCQGPALPAGYHLLLDEKLRRTRQGSILPPNAMGRKMRAMNVLLLKRNHDRVCQLGMTTCSKRTGPLPEIMPREREREREKGEGDLNKPGILRWNRYCMAGLLRSPLPPFPCKHASERIRQQNTPTCTPPYPVRHGRMIGWAVMSTCFVLRTYPL